MHFIRCHGNSVIHYLYYLCMNISGIIGLVMCYVLVCYLISNSNIRLLTEIKHSKESLVTHIDHTKYQDKEDLLI